MKRPRNKTKRPVHALNLWTIDQSRKALPYLRSIASSLREHWLEANRCRLEAKRLKDRPGRADRNALIAREEAVQAACRAEDAFHEALEELQSLDIFCLDPAQGLALIPFNQGDELAWFVFDLFKDKGGLETWRFHRDPLEMRRPLHEAAAEPANKKVKE